MDISKFIELAKEAQKTLAEFGCPAEHIYLVGYSKILGTDFKPSFVFVSSAYDTMDLYTRSQLAMKIHKGPLNINYYLFGPIQIQKSNLPISRESIHKSIKIFGKKSLPDIDPETFSQRNYNKLEKQN